MLETGGRQLLATSRLEATSTATALPAGAVGGYRGHVLDAANLEAGAGQRAQGGLPARAGALGLVATRSAHLDVKRGQTQLLAPNCDILRGKHRRVGGRLIAIGLHLHATSNTADCLFPREISHVHESVVEAREDVSDAEDVLALAGVGEPRLLFLHHGGGNNLGLSVTSHVMCCGACRGQLAAGNNNYFGGKSKALLSYAPAPVLINSTSKAVC
mmetsp:Transcript_5018/g.12749  ORF Transcript_5018/g.12749 Transcript_5018/m.12749 type:complete len:215 (+) Transcript_5018:100-744(+)